MKLLYEQPACPLLTQLVAQSRMQLFFDVDLKSSARYIIFSPLASFLEAKHLYEPTCPSLAQSRV